MTLCVMQGLELTWCDYKASVKVLALLLSQRRYPFCGRRLVRCQVP